MSYSLAEILTHLEAKYSFLFTDCSAKLRSKPTSLKDYLLNYAYINANEKKLIIEPSLEDIKKFKNSLFLDFEHFYIKTIIQYMDYLKQIERSKTWNIVTFYYFLFFSITALSKYIGCSCLYLSSDEFNKMAKNIIGSYDTKLFGKGLYTYSVQKIDHQLCLILQKDTSGMHIHEKTWHLFYEFLKELSKNLINDRTEIIIVNQIINCMDKYKPAFPSKIRNIVNYQGIYAIEEIKNNIPVLIHKELNNFFTIRPTAKDSYDIQLECSLYIGIFMFRLLKDLHSDINMRLKTKHNEFYELQKTFYSCRTSDMDIFDNLFQ